ncbi:hypothetical protein T08_13597 [Trichinella sp. T8]|nr:hypothetical protein T08_13597 [Trichinella sp. T8]
MATVQTTNTQRVALRLVIFTFGLIGSRIAKNRSKLIAISVYALAITVTAWLKLITLHKNQPKGQYCNIKVETKLNGMHNKAINKSANAKLAIRALVGVRRRGKWPMIKMTVALPITATTTTTATADSSAVSATSPPDVFASSGDDVGCRRLAFQEDIVRQTMRRPARPKLLLSFSQSLRPDARLNDVAGKADTTLGSFPV